MPSCRLISIFTGHILVLWGSAIFQHWSPPLLRLPPRLSPVPAALLLGSALNDLLGQWIKVEVPF